MPPQKRSTINLPPDFYKEYTDYFKEHEKALKDMEITDVSKLIRFSANMGKPKVDEIIKKIES